MAFIRLDRSFFTGKFWNQQRTFSLAEAWLDLIQLARFDVGSATKILANGREIEIKRGEIHASLRFLALRWGWGVEKTQRFIESAIKNKAIERRIEQGESIIKLCNYDTYNPTSNTDQDTDQHTDQHTDQTATSTNNKNEEKEEKDKKEKKGEGKPPSVFTPPTLEEVQAQILAKGYKFDAETFISFYSSKGWMVGSNKMKDWRAALVTWKKRQERDISANSRSTPHPAAAQVKQTGFKQF